MTTTLKTKWFTKSQEIVDFVNLNEIARENIQSITSIGDVFVIFYWEVNV